MIFYFTFKTLQLFLKVTKCIVSSAVYTNIEKNIDYQVHNYNTFSTATLLHYSLVNICIPLPAWCEARATCRDFHPAKLPLRQRLLLLLSFLKTYSAEHASKSHHQQHDHDKSKNSERVLLYLATSFIYMKGYETSKGLANIR